MKTVIIGIREYNNVSSHQRSNQLGGYMATIAQQKKRPAIIEGNIAKIPLGVDAKDGYAIVDKEHSSLDQYNWSLANIGYPITNINRTSILMHRLIMGNNPKGMVTDHINRVKLDNRKCNLRFISQQTNTMNAAVSVNNKSGYKGVSRYNIRGKAHGWVAVIHINGKKIHGGVFKNKVAAAKRYNELAIKYHGEHAYQNEVD